MPPSIASRESPRTLHGRRRAPRGQLARSGSIFGAIKNIVTAPLAWFTSYEDGENGAGKRGRNFNPVLEDEGTYHEDQPSAKRKRVDSPSPPAPPSRQATRPAQGYLDVPENMLSQQAGNRQRQSAPGYHGRSSSLFTSLSVPAVPGAQPARRTASPTGITSYMQPSMIQHTQSMDPPPYRALSLSRDVSMEDGVSGTLSRDVTMSPSRHTPFQLRPRSSMTPQPSGQTFGPVSRHKEWDASEPPPLASLISKPVFVKPPPQHVQNQPEQLATTLGSIAESTGRVSRSPMRQHSSLFLGARPGTSADSSSTPFVVPMNAAEKALHGLDVYKTPLLPSRLRGSQTIPDMFKPKKVHAPVLMRSERDREWKPRLGTSEKGKKKEEDAAAAAKPYAGRGGMKKMLARRKREEQEELEKERASAIETDQDEAEKSFESQELENAKKTSDFNRLPSPPPVPAPPARPVGGREQSSLRVGRTRTSRNHIARPVSKSKNRFSAAYEEDEGDDAMLDEARDQQTAPEEAKKLPTLFESPKNFSFAQDKAPVSHDSSNAKEPPIPALPFSLTKSSPTPSGKPSVAPAFSFGEPSKAVTPVTGPAQADSVARKAPGATAAAPTAPLFPLAPSISLVPPSPTPVKPIPEAATSGPIATSAATTTAPSIPNFFANSAIFSKPGVTIALPTPTAHTDAAKPQPSPAPPAFNFGASASATKEPIPSTEKPAATFSFGSPPVAPSSSSPFSFAPESAASQPAGSLFTASQVVSREGAAPEVKPAAAVNPGFSFGPAKPAETKPVETSPAQPGLPFSFGNSSASNAAPVAASPAPAPAASPFTFGQSAPKPTETKASFEPAKPPLFGAPAPSPSPFAGRQSSTGTEAPKPAFTFGQSTPSPSTSAPTIEAPKPLLSSTSSGGTTGFNFGSAAPAAPSPALPAKSPFSFGVALSTPTASTPVENKPAFTFGVSSTPAVSAPTALFGGLSNGSQSTDSGKFTFGASAPARPITPPQKEHEMRMEESPTRGAGMEVNGEQHPTLKPSNGFTFGQSSVSTTSPFSQPSVGSSFSFGAKTEIKPDHKPGSFASFGQSAAAPGFFGQKPAESIQSPISPAPFGASTPFGQTPTTSTPSFTFGAPSAPSAGGFGQSSSTMNSQPASPSTFGQQTTPFGFGATPTSTTAPSNPFAFGSQPASPATGNAGLPQPPGSSGGPAFTFGAANPATSQAPSSPFGAPPSLPAVGGGVGFTIGSAAPQPAGGARQIRKLPNRRGGGRPR